MFVHISIISPKSAHHSLFCLFSRQLAICIMCNPCNSPVTLLKEVNSVMNETINFQSTNIEAANEIQPGDIIQYPKSSEAKTRHPA